MFNIYRGHRKLGLYDKKGGDPRSGVNGEKYT